MTNNATIHTYSKQSSVLTCDHISSRMCLYLEVPMGDLVGEEFESISYSNSYVLLSVKDSPTVYMIHASGSLVSVSQGSLWTALGLRVLSISKEVGVLNPASLYSSECNPIRKITYKIVTDAGWTDFRFICQEKNAKIVKVGSYTEENLDD